MSPRLHHLLPRRESTGGEGEVGEAGSSVAGVVVAGRWRCGNQGKWGGIGGNREECENMMLRHIRVLVNRDTELSQPARSAVNEGECWQASELCVA